ncbi:MAG: glycoside hydrolase family 3 C-terminal domain-containing protein, partial [Acidimicrobiia bacterium]|nr:glycoside hydrolase family 3 C-terminal domain-containing protein [Acidimicrobiia bacterium]
REHGDEPERQGSLGSVPLRELARLTAGADLWHTHASAAAGLPALKMSDGPNGVRGARYEDGPASTCFPVATALAATWDVDLVERVGSALATEARDKAVDVLLAPTLNLHRHPLGGRNFECFSEDPELTARLGVAFVRGVQAQGVACCAKHFVANESEVDRYGCSSDVTERPLRELYLRPFEAVVREAGVWAVMTAYNALNGTPCAANRWLLTDVLRTEWGFDGVVLSDWGGAVPPAAALHAGLDLEMPGPGEHLGEAVADAVEAGALAAADVHRSAARLKLLARRAGAEVQREVRAERSVDRVEHRALAREAAAASMVLLRNRTGPRSAADGQHALPLELEAGRRLAIVGELAARATIMGGGSSEVRSLPVSQPLDALRQHFERLGVDVRYEPGCPVARFLPRWEPPGGFELLLSDTDATDPAPARAVDDPSEACKGSPAAETVWRPAGAVGRIGYGTWPDGVEVRPDQPIRWRALLESRAADRWRVGLIVAGWGRVWIDGALVVDSTSTPHVGATFYGHGTDELLAEITPGGGVHEVLIEYRPLASVPFRGVRFGLARSGRDDGIERAAGAARGADAAIVFVGLDRDWQSEGADRTSFDLPGDQAAMVEAVATVCPRTIVVVNAASPVRLDWEDQVAAVVYAWFPGMEFGNALVDVVSGATDFRGRLPTTLPRRLEDCPAYLSYPGEAGHAVYGEGIFAGYRGFDATDTDPRYPFGFGLSYTTFSYEAIEVEARGDEVLVAVRVRNVGGRAGREVVQLYVSHRSPGWARPPKELVDFAAVELPPGAAAHIEFRLSRRAFSVWDPLAADWSCEPGTYCLLAGSSSRLLPLGAEVVLPTS